MDRRSMVATSSTGHQWICVYALNCKYKVETKNLSPVIGLGGWWWCRDLQRRWIHAHAKEDDGQMNCTSTTISVFWASPSWTSSLQVISRHCLPECSTDSLCRPLNRKIIMIARRNSTIKLMINCGKRAAALTTIGDLHSWSAPRTYLLMRGTNSWTFESHDVIPIKCRGRN